MGYSFEKPPDVIVKLPERSNLFDIHEIEVKNLKLPTYHYYPSSYSDYKPASWESFGSTFNK